MVKLTRIRQIQSAQSFHSILRPGAARQNITAARLRTEPSSSAISSLSNVSDITCA
jgi:hypothetical protein